jgi:hypothetical protein
VMNSLDLVGDAVFGVGQVGEPFESGRDFGEPAILRRCERTLCNRNQVL